MDEDTTPLVYVCGTMWHETETEMLLMMKSIFRLDEDQCARKNAQMAFDIVDPDFYNMEAHIVFDDAFEPHAGDSTEYHVNNFVKQLVKIVDKAASKVYGLELRLAPPTKYATPFGGRLEWNLPGGNKFAVHLKDKVRVRHKKRWSQVLYLFYLLEYQVNSQHLDEQCRRLRDENSYILTLDGDVDFKPSAVQLLVDRMKRNKEVAAVRGRIHPVGKGPFVWYQVFEYAMGHWLQKATDYITGCILCTPGCFSLFRASALMNKNVIGKYVNTAKTAQHVIKVDHGEDRWLCTLLLRQGYKIEYSASSDAKSFCPEGFDELMNQQKRWIPADVAHSLDFLARWRTAVSTNDHISLLFLFYQLLLFATGLVRPGLILLLINEGIVSAFPFLHPVAMLALLCTPVIFFQVSCFLFKPKSQLWIAKVLSVFYCLVMVAVFAGLGIKLWTDGICSWTTIFTLGVLSVIVVVAVLHPKEVFCLAYLPIFCIAFPSIYIFEMLYAIGNMHVVSWGTREVKTPVEGANSAGKGSVEEVKMQSSPIGRFSCKNLFRRLFSRGLRYDSPENVCSTSLSSLDTGLSEAECSTDSKLVLVFDGSETSLQLVVNEQTEQHGYLNEAITCTGVDGKQTKQTDIFSIQDCYGYPVSTMTPTDPSLIHALSPFELPISSPATGTCDDESSLVWIKDGSLGTGLICRIKDEEKSFWDDLIKKHLHKLVLTEDEQERIRTDLTKTRTKMSWIYFLINIVIMAVLYPIQDTGPVKKGIPVPCYTKDGGLLLFQPKMIIFIVVCSSVILIQLVALIFDRISTAIHILRNTSVSSKARNVKHKVALSKVMQKIENTQGRPVVTMRTGSTLDKYFLRSFHHMAPGFRQDFPDGALIDPVQFGLMSPSCKNDKENKRVQRLIESVQENRTAILRNAEQLQLYLQIDDPSLHTEPDGKIPVDVEYEDSLYSVSTSSSGRELIEKQNKTKIMTGSYTARVQRPKNILTRIISGIVKRASNKQVPPTNPFNGIKTRIWPDKQPWSVATHL